MTDDRERRPIREDWWEGREAKDFLHPPTDDPPDRPVPIDPPDEGGGGGGEGEDE